MNTIINFVFSIPAAFVVALDSISPNKDRVLKDKPLKLRPLKWDYFPFDLNNQVGNLSNHGNIIIWLGVFSIFYLMLIIAGCLFALTEL